MSQAHIGPKPLAGVIETDEDEETEILGVACWIVTGDVLVPREWLQEQLEAKGLAGYIPTAVWPSSAHKRAMARLMDVAETESTINGHDVSMRLTNEDDGEPNRRHVYADVWYPEREIGVKGGESRSQKLGHFDYDSDYQKMTFTTTVGEDTKIHDEWLRLVGQAQGLFRKMESHHIEQDLRGIIDTVRANTSSVRLRQAGGFYFIPAWKTETIESLSSVWARMNEFKESGYPCRIGTIPVVNDRKRREEIERCVQREVEQRVDDVVETGLETLTEESDKTAEEIAEEVVEELEDTGTLAEEYSQLLNAKLSIRRHIKRWLNEVEGQKEKVVQEIQEEL